MLEQQQGVIWFDGQLIPWQDASIHVLSHSLHYGMGVFEGVRAYETAAGPALFRLDDHTQRLFDSLKIMNMSIAYDAATLNAAQQAVIAHNQLRSAYVRPICFYGSEHLGVSVKGMQSHVAVAAWPWKDYLGEKSIKQGISVKVSSYTRHHVNSAMCRAKATGQYINSVLAVQDAQHDGYEEAILLDTQGYVAEGSAENIFLVKDKVLHTPQLTSCLAGITRDTIIQLAKELGYQVMERPITRDELYIADEVFFTGTAAEVTPVCSIDKRLVGTGQVGAVTFQLQQLYFNVVLGKSSAHQHWLTYVESVDNLTPA